MITVIIATYNAQDSLQETINSLISQTNQNFELIVIDGDSNDETVDIIKINEDIINKFLSEPDEGIYDAWNKGIKLSHGDWICFLGAGDTLVPDAFEKYEELLSCLNGEFDYISAKINRIDDYGNFLSVIGKAWDWKEFKSIMTVAHVGSLHNRALFDQIGYYNVNYKICADYELLLRKKNKLKSSFLNYTIGNMPIGGKSFSVPALKESAKAKYITGKQSYMRVLFSFIFQYVLFKTFAIRHKKI